MEMDPREIRKLKTSAKEKKKSLFVRYYILYLPWLGIKVMAHPSKLPPPLPIRE